ncbi:hypothetical protein P7E02_10790 [Enterococcus hulanensis]|uniref:hypothetical protein n=1 Tax=Enterococcus hulanensis TaxID=2559929 RepID=UPI00288D702F|nr:hypothetical protein [Enterococcus hulanensis]MDT2660359.1 hypothetical protein [Enterococcus hulanensis]
MKKIKPLIFVACCVLLIEQAAVPALAFESISESGSQVTTSTEESTDSASNEESIDGDLTKAESIKETIDSSELVKESKESIEDPLDIDENTSALDETLSEGKKKAFLNDSNLELSIENEKQFKAALLGESYEDSEGVVIDYGEIDDSQEIKLLLNTDLMITEAIQGIQRKRVEIVGNETERQISSENSDCFLSFSNQLNESNQLAFSGIKFSNVLSDQDFIHTEGQFVLRFIDTSFYINGANTSIQLNNQSTVYFLGQTSISSYSGNVANLILANEVVFDDHFEATLQGTGATSVITANQINFLENANAVFKKSNQSNTGAVINLSGSAPKMQISDQASVEVEQSGKFVNIESYQNSSFILGSMSSLILLVGQGFSGNGTSYFDKMELHAGSQFVINEFGTVTNVPAIQVGSSFIVENGSSQHSTVLKGKRSSSTASAFIQMSLANGVIQIGDYSQISVEQFGPMITGVSTTKLAIGNHVNIENKHDSGLTGTVAIENIQIGDDCSIQLTESPSGAASNSYSVFLARSEIKIGQNTTIDFKQTRTTSTNPLFNLSTANGQLSIGEGSEIKLDTRGAVLQGASATVTLHESSKVRGTVGQGFTGTTTIRKLEMGMQSGIDLTEHATNTDTVMFNIQESFKMADRASLKAHRSSNRTSALVKLSGANSSFQTADGCQFDIYQIGAAFEGLRTTKLLFGTQNTVDITSSRGLTGSSGAMADSIYSLDIGADTKMTLTEHATTIAQNFIRLRSSISIGERAELNVNRPSSRNTPVIRLAYSNSKFTMMEQSKLKVKANGAALYGTSSTDVLMDNNTEVAIESGYGLTGNNSIRSLTIGKHADIQLNEPTSGNAPATSLSVPAIRVARQFVLGENAILESTRERTTSDSRFMRLNSANSTVKLEKNAVMKVKQRGGIFNPTATSSFVMADGAVFDGITAYGFTQSSRRFKEMMIQKGATFNLTDEGSGAGSGSAYVNRPMIDVGEKISVEEDAKFIVKTEINRSELLYFRSRGAQLNVSDVERFELNHPTTRSGSSNTTLQRLIRSATNTTSRGLVMNIDNQKLSLWTSQQEEPNEEFINISGQLKINRNNGIRPSFTLNAEGRSRFLHAEQIIGANESKDGSDIYDTIQKNNYHKLILSKPEGLIARINPISDQSEEITGYMYEESEIIKISYTDLQDETHLIEEGSPEIIWGEYRDEDELYRNFTISLGEKRLNTDTEVSIFLSKPSIESFIDITTTAKVIKGLDYEAFNATLLKDKVNGFDTDEELYQYILNETRVNVQNVLTKEDITEKARVIDTDLTRSVSEDRTYYATIEVGHKAYQFTVALDVTSNADQMRIVIPTKMLFETLYSNDNSSREFQSQDYQIRNHSTLDIDTYVNSFSIKEESGVVLLNEDEDPLDYAISEEEEEEESVLTEDDIRTPLIKLFVKSKDGQIQLANRMSEKHLTTLEKKSTETIGLNGKFYGDYPRWIEDSEEEQGGYYEETLAPKYKMVLRFVPKAD